MKILISGASGFIGKPLADLFRSQGYKVVPLVRGDFRAKNPGGIVWDPAKGQAPKREELEGISAVVHLAGEPLSLGPWSEEKKRRILDSRQEGTRLLSHALAQLAAPPRVFLSASAVGFYGDRGEEMLTEKSPSGRGFLASVCSAWEKASGELKERGVRTVHARFGIVLGPEGGALQKMIPIYRWGLGGRLGSGQQWIGWIERGDLLRALLFMVGDERLEGPVNAVSPFPVRQEEFARLLARALHRPAPMRVPAWLLRLFLGEAADSMLLASARAVPAKLLEAGFSFQSPELSDAFHKALKL